MPHKIPEEITVAKSSIEAARVALEALFEKMQASPRSQKIIAADNVQEACSRLRVAQALLAELEVTALRAADPA